MANTLKPILIFECANTHGGDYNLLLSMIKEHGKVVYEHKHIKFQPLHPEKIATSSYEWFGVYKELYFSITQWSKILQIASMTFDGVWLDLFDVYGVEVLKANLNSICGVKFQASVLDNQEVLDELRAVDFSGKFIMLNVSGYELSEIQFFIDNFKKIALNAEFILQIGFQSYPTKLADTGLQKIAIIKAAFPDYKVCVADHANAEDEMATIIPLLALPLGCALVEKHIAYDRATSKYDGFSSLNVKEMQLLADRLSKTSEVLNGPFISEAECKYLVKTIQIPILKKSINPGMLLSKNDFIYRRTNKEGISYSQIKEIQKKQFAVSQELAQGDSIKSTDFKLAKVGAIVACRMKSSRLKNKAILPIFGKASVERCLESMLRIEGLDTVVLATSTLDEDKVLEKYNLNGQVKFWQGDPDDVISRYLGACEEYGIDVIVRVTADCPVTSSEIAKVLLKHHFETGADYTAANEFAVGTSCEIYNTEALKRVISYVGKANYSEYMTWYMQNNKDIFKVELVDLPKDMIRNYRLTLDHEEDLEMFCRLFEKIDEMSMQITLSNIFKILDENPAIAEINSHISLKYKTDKTLIDTLNKATKIVI
jgi:spore coat polysaccharide biosynthesis protein SpsF (cytidylyltransferase family)/sialic acid synthase SpsE